MGSENRPSLDNDDAKDEAKDSFNNDLTPPCVLDEKQDQTAVQRLMRLFATYDVNGNGCLDIRTFQDMLQHVAPGLCGPGMLEKLTESEDANGDGEIHYAEFLAWVFNESVVTDTLMTASSTF